MSLLRFEPDAILFDLDGLLVDSEPTWALAEHSVMRSWGAPWTDQDAIATRGTGIPETARRMSEKAGRPFDEVRDPERLVQTFLELAPSIAEKPGAHALLLAAREVGVRTAVASSSPRRLVTAVLEARGLTAYFDTIVTGDDVPRKKPDPAIFLLAAARLGVAPRACLVLEDSMPGVLGAKNGGIPVIAVPEVDKAAFTGVADAVVDDLLQARSLIHLDR